MPDLAGDAGAEHGAARLAFQRDDPVVYGHREPGRVGEEPVRDHVLSDLPADLLVAALEDAQHVGPADDAGQPPVAVDDGKPLEPVLAHQAGGGLHRVVRADRHRGVAHQVARGSLLGRPVPAVVPPGRQGQQVRLGHHAGHLPVVAVTGNPLTRCSRNMAATRRYGVSGRTVTTPVVMMSLTYAFMTSVSPADGTARKRRNSLRQVTEVPYLGPWPALPISGFLQVSRPGGGPDGGGGHAGSRAGAAALTTAAEAGSSRHQAAELPEGFWYAVKRRALGPAAGHRAAQEPAPVQAAGAGRAVLRRALLGGLRHRGDPARAAPVLRPGRLLAGAADDPAPSWPAPAGPGHCPGPGCTRRKSAR